ncbi:MAG: deoxynucleoside kinase [Gammaproteobacteria bacterium]|nr:deoxynucleoside kinase [Gammaproteobacteria bacterium]
MTTPKYIVVEGPIGIGKTTLARRLAQTFGSDLLLEDAAANPFLERFYQHPRQAALSTQLFFLLQRVRQMRDMQQSLSQPDMFRPAGRVADFLIEKDPLFAQLTLDDDDLRLYEQVHQQLAPDAPPPDLVIYLQAPVEVLLTRIAKRGRGYEKLIESSYLQRLTDAYARFFHHYSAAPLLIVNAAEVNYVENDRDYNLLVDQVRAIRSGRHYFNPLPFA